jgi:sugar-specific transcriptional regulator TrmB
MLFANANSKLNDDIIIKVQGLLTVLARMDNLRMFIAARGGIRYSPALIEKMGLSRKRYYHALYELNRHGLIRRTADSGKSFHTVFGEMIYLCIQEMNRFNSHIVELKMIDVLKQTGEFPPDRILNLLERISDDEKIVRNISGTLEMVWSYNDMVKVLVQHFQVCKKEILVATRILSEEIIRALLAKVTQGIRVQILSDASLVESYFAMQNVGGRDDQSGSYEADRNNPERIEVVGNPWYPDKRIQRRITRVPFGMVIIDGVKVGMELIDAHNTEEFSGGIIVNDGKVAEVMKNYYQKLWMDARDFNTVYQSRL